jgi:hypothetical protein
LRDLALALKKMNLSISQCADGSRIYRILTKLGVEEYDIERFMTTIYKKANAIGLGPQKIAAILNDLLSFAESGQGSSKKQTGEAEDEASIPDTTLLSQIPAYIARKKAEKNQYEHEIAQLRSARDALLDEKSKLEESNENLLQKNDLTKNNLEWYAGAKEELEREGIPVEDVISLRDAVKWVQEKGEDLPEIIKTFANYRALQVEKRSLESQLSSLREQARSMQTSNANLENMLETNSLTISILEELAMLGFDYKQLKRLNALLLQISKAHWLTTSHGLAVEKFLTEIEEDYDDVQGFKSTIEKLRKNSRELALRLRTERSIFEALPHLNEALGSLLRRGVREDQIVKISELLESCPNFIELYAKPSDIRTNPEVPFATASTASTSTSTVRMATKNIQDEAPSQVDNAQLNNFTRAEYVRSEMGTVQNEIDKNNSVETGLITSSQHKVSEMKGVRQESTRMPGNESLARLNAAVVRYEELAIFGVTSSGHSAGHPPSSVTDINSSTSWIGQQSGGWLQLDLGSGKNIHRINIAWSPHSLGQINFAISVSEDGISFAEKRVGSSDNAYPSYEMYHLPQNTYGRYIRITIQEPTRDDRFGISGIVLYGPHSQQT